MKVIEPVSIRKAAMAPAASGVAPQGAGLEIQELVLRGFPSGQGKSIVAAMQQELVRLAAQPGFGNARGLADQGAKAAAIHVAAGGRPKAVGRQIAQAVYGDIRRQGKASRFRESTPRGGRA